jgi:FMN reductase
MTTPRIVAISGSLWVPSKTSALARLIALRLAHATGGRPETVEISALSAELGATLSARDATPRVRQALDAVASADILVAASPVFRGSFGGHFKHFFDLIELDAVQGKPVVLAATGGGEKHCLVLEHALRPLFSFLGAHTTPTAVYAADRDFEAGELTNSAVLSRVETSVHEALLIHGSSAGRLARAERSSTVADSSTN